MKSIKILLAGMILLPSFTFAQGGGMVGGGGVSVVCRDSQKKIISVEILDTFEGANQYDLVYENQQIPISTMVELAQLKMLNQPAFLTQFKEVLSSVRAAMKFLPAGVGPTPTNDAFPVIKKKGCKFEQLASFVDGDSKLYIDEEIYRKLSRLDQAALLVHETVYKIARLNRGDVSSVRSRKLTSNLMASNGDAGVIDALMRELLAPPPVVRNRLQDGYYGTKANYCGQELVVSGDTLIATNVKNRSVSLQCAGPGSVVFFTWDLATFEDGSSAMGYMNKCDSDSSKWCNLIQVVNEYSFILHASGEKVMFTRQ